MTADATKPVEPRVLKPSGHVGFDSLPDQLVNKAISQGFIFNVLCVGETGLGKTTLLETLFNQKLEFTPSSHELSEVQLKSTTVDLKEGSAKLKLTITETCGFGDQINRDESTKAVIDFIDEQYENYFQEERSIKRNFNSIHDGRVHVCLYFISPSGHSLKSLDLVSMKKLEGKVNIIPVIAKSDTITKSELAQFKQRIMSEINGNAIQIYKFPTDDEAVSEVNKRMNGIVPFAVVGSNEEVVIKGKSVRARQYRWGAVVVENEAHCDFVQLREMLLRVNMEDLRERTHVVHYETYRRQRLTEMGYTDDETLSLGEIYEKHREQQTRELQEKEDEMRNMFVKRVKDKEQALKEAERQLQAKYEEIQKQYTEDKRKFTEKQLQLEEEKAAYERKKNATDQAKNSAFTMKKKK